MTEPFIRIPGASEPADWSCLVALDSPSEIEDYERKLRGQFGNRAPEVDIAQFIQQSRINDTLFDWLKYSEIVGEHPYDDIREWAEQGLRRLMKASGKCFQILGEVLQVSE